MVFNPLLLVTAALALVDASPIVALPAVEKKAIKTSFSYPAPLKGRSASVLTVSNNVVALSKRSVRYNSRSAAFLLNKIPAVRLTGTYANGSSSVLTSLELGEEYATPIKIGSTTFEVIVDTGSSDTWVVENNFECVSLSTGKKTTQASCEFGPTYTLDSSFVTTSNEEFKIEYGDGEELTGLIGTDTVTLAGVTVTGQTIAVANYAEWEGDGTTSGLTGLAYTAITSAYNTKSGAQVLYSPIIETIINKDLIPSPLFSLAIQRDQSGPAGYLALGGVPPIAFNQTFTSTPLIVTSISGYPKAYDFYSINIASVYLNGKALASSGGTSVQYIVDSGTTLNYFPTSVANAINAAFSPAATYSDDEGAYVVSCTAKAPVVAIDIAGTLFYINPLDLILDAGDGTCISGVDDGGSSDTEDLFILGDTFQKNVITIFDVGAVELLFAPYENYTSNDTY